MYDTLEREQNEVVLNTLECIYDLTDDERENVRHELWQVIDAAGSELNSDSFWNAIDLATERGLAYTRSVA